VTEHSPPPLPKSPDPDVSRTVSINSFDVEQVARMNTLRQGGKDWVQIEREEMNEIGGRLGTISEHSVREQ
jgi:hypothetical protein